MRDACHSTGFNSNRAAVHPTGAHPTGAMLLCVALVGAIAIAITPVQAHARPIYARETGLPCSRCHIDPAGGGARTAFGKAFAANGHRLPGGWRGHWRDDGQASEPGMMGGHGRGMMGGYGHGMMNRE